MTLIILIFNVRAYRKNHFENNNVDNVIFIEMIPEVILLENLIIYL